MTIVGGTWTYSGDPAASDKDAVRHLLGDTDERDQKLSDQEIDWELAQGGAVRTVAARAAKALSARYGVQPSDKKVGDLSITYGDRAKFFTDLAAELSEESAVYAIPRAGGISQADKAAVVADTDRVAPSFSRGMFDHPEVGYPDSPTSGY